ncbi:MAG: hypothetical protein WCB49_08000 [Gammaproteobacteria bacterium]
MGVSKGLRYGLVLAVLAIAGAGGAMAASGGAQAQVKAASRFALTQADMKPFAARPTSPTAGGIPVAGPPLAVFFDAHFDDPLRRAERCENLSKVRPPDYYSLHVEQSGLKTFGGIRIPFRPWAAYGVMPNTGERISDSVDIYLLCLQNSRH